MGYIMPEIFRFPGCESFQHGLGALESIPLEGWVQLVALVGAHEAEWRVQVGMDLNRLLFYPPSNNHRS